MYEILIPREFTKLDEIVDLVFSTAEDVKKIDAELETEDGVVTEDRTEEGRKPKFTPVSFNPARCGGGIRATRNASAQAHPRPVFGPRRRDARALCGFQKPHGR